MFGEYLEALANSILFALNLPLAGDGPCAPQKLTWNFKDRKQ